MNATVELTPDQLANLISAVFEANGYNASGLALYLNGELVGYDRAVVHCKLVDELNVYHDPQAMTRKQLDEMLYPYAGPTTFDSRKPAGSGATVS